jgi:hypothetical protein
MSEKQNEKTADELEQDRIIQCIEQGVSPCCNVALDESRVIRFRRYKNHGPRFCSLCQKLIYHV